MLGWVSVKESLAQERDQTQGSHLWRENCDARPDWKQKCERLGFHFHSAEGIKYSNWDQVSASGRAIWCLLLTERMGLQDIYYKENGMYVLSEVSDPSFLRNHSAMSDADLANGASRRELRCWISQ
eukprot:897643-Rhodomonas_salina.1